MQNASAFFTSCVAQYPECVSAAHFRESENGNEDIQATIHSHGGTQAPAPARPGVAVARLCRHGPGMDRRGDTRSEEHTSELQSQSNLVCRLLLEKKKKKTH